MFTRYIRRIQKARTAQALNTLSDRQLEDIGMSRGDIPARVESIFNE